MYSLSTYIVNIGIDIYKTFSIENRYGFNKSTVKTFILDQFKNIFLTIILGLPLFYLILTIYNKLGDKLGKISIIDASKRSSRLNAYFSGFGKFKHIVLYDTLLSKCTTDQIISILAHEIGHSKHNDVLKNYLISTLNLGIYLSLLGYFLTSNIFANNFGFENIHICFSLILFSILMEAFTLIINIPLSAISRKADAFSGDLGFNKYMIKALKIFG